MADKYSKQESSSESIWDNNLNESSNGNQQDIASFEQRCVLNFSATVEVIQPPSTVIKF
jgi:hypothetical protein